MFNERLYFGTCSWKYDSWRNLIYPPEKEINYLREYARVYKSVEIDQWFWSLFGVDKVALPAADTVREYVESTPDDFRFTIKVPNSITLTHFYPKDKNDPLVVNPYFLSAELFGQFMDILRPMSGQIAALMFQFEYLNKRKMPSIQAFLEKCAAFLQRTDPQLNIAFEIRNPNYLTARYFDFLREGNIAHVFLEGYYMPPVFDVYQKFKPNFAKNVVVRLHGPSRADIEKLSGGIWNRILDPHDADLQNIVQMLAELIKSNHKVFMNVNNHYEGSAPLTIRRLEKIISEKPELFTGDQVP